MKDQIIEAVKNKFGLRAEIIESWVVFAGQEGEGLEYCKLSLEDDEIKVYVEMSDRSLLPFFNDLLGEPKRIK